jgi:hypothetical protein
MVVFNIFVHDKNEHRSCLDKLALVLYSFIRTAQKSFGSGSFHKIDFHTLDFQDKQLRNRLDLQHLLEF